VSLLHNDSVPQSSLACLHDSYAFAGKAINMSVDSFETNTSGNNAGGMLGLPLRVWDDRVCSLGIIESICTSMQRTHIVGVSPSSGSGANCSHLVTEYHIHCRFRS
jgi:hypothetical protein